jgi:Icc-related predicted phosphoesterase
MKTRILLTSVAIVALTIVGIGSISRCKDTDNNLKGKENVDTIDTPEGQSGLPRFAVMSDIHFGGGVATERVARALKNLLSNGRLDALFVVGDLADHGLATEYDELLAVYRNPANVPADLPVYYMMGNHDHGQKNGKEIYMSKLGQPMNQYIEIKGYPFITISMTGSGSLDFNQEARTFLATHMDSASKKYPGKPIFVFMHIPPQNTCYGSSVSDGWGTPVFLPTLNQYPQAVVFAGHSHWPIGDPRSIHQDAFTSVNDGSTYYSEIEGGTVNVGSHPERYGEVTEGIIVSLLENGNVEMERWDTRRKEEILPRWTVEAPHDGSMFTYKNRNGLPAPSFPVGATMTTTHGDESCTVTFPQASDNDVVHHYLIEILEGNNVVMSYGKFSQFYLNSEMPATLTATIPCLPDNKPLTAQVKAVDSYNNQSAAIIGSSFTLPPATPADIVGSWLFDDATDLTKATVGTALQFHTTGGAIASVDGPTAANKAIRIPQKSYLQVLHGLAPKNGETYVNDYAIQIYFKVPSLDKWYSFMQTDLNNNNDADIFINKNGNIGVTSIGYSPKSITTGKWHRLLISAQLGSYMNIYLDGELLLGTNSPANDRHALNAAGVLLFADEDGEDAAIDVAEITIWNKHLNATQVSNFK